MKHIKLYEEHSEEIDNLRKDLYDVGMSDIKIEYNAVSDRYKGRWIEEFEEHLYNFKPYDGFQIKRVKLSAYDDRDTVNTNTDWCQLEMWVDLFNPKDPDEVRHMEITYSWKIEDDPKRIQWKYPMEDGLNALYRYTKKISVNKKPGSWMWYRVESDKFTLKQRLELLESHMAESKDPYTGMLHTIDEVVKNNVGR